MASPRRSLPPGLKPFWAVDNISEATRTFSIETDKYSGHIIGNQIETRREKLLSNRTCSRGFVLRDVCISLPSTLCENNGGGGEHHHHRQ